ncbi:MAG: hypothetical protein JKY45_02500 [Emcibacter sp.]|nr:hypothetical protein [Emcibacter sp.]
MQFDCGETEEKRPRVIVWFSRGAASAIAGALTLQKYSPEQCMFVCCDTGAEHPDSDRFEADIVKRFNMPITHLISKKFKTVWEVWEKRKWLAGIEGAPCTSEMKIKPRLDFQEPGDIHIFGYTADKADQIRANRLRMNYPDLKIETPLIDAGLFKEHVLQIIANMGIKLPLTYVLGFPNNNCIPCSKATSPNYWALVRKHFPDEFYRMAKLCRKFGARLTRINDIRIFIDEIPADWPTTTPIMPSCDFLCGLAEMGLNDHHPEGGNDADT